MAEMGTVSLSRYHSSVIPEQISYCICLALEKGNVRGSCMEPSDLCSLPSSIVQRKQLRWESRPGLLREKGGGRVGKPGLNTHHSPIAVDQ
ncbi:uncharacterized [Tachysurus ichikawai]